jgi:hypothetical protein
MNARLPLVLMCALAACEDTASLSRLKQSRARQPSSQEDRQNATANPEGTLPAFSSENAAATDASATERPLANLPDETVAKPKATTQPAVADGATARLALALFEQPMSEADLAKLNAHLDMVQPTGTAGSAQGNLQHATTKAIDILEHCLARLDKDANPQNFTNVITNLATALIDRMQAAQGAMKAELKHGREVDYHALQHQVTKLAAAQVKAEGEHAETIERLRASVQAKVHQLEESLDLLDQTITRLETRQRRAEQAVVMWSDANTFAASTTKDCEILRDDFVIVFQGRRR